MTTATVTLRALELRCTACAQTITGPADLAAGWYASHRQPQLGAVKLETDDGRAVWWDLTIPGLP